MRGPWSTCAAACNRRMGPGGWKPGAATSAMSITGPPPTAASTPWSASPACLPPTASPSPTGCGERPPRRMSPSATPDMDQVMTDTPISGRCDPRFEPVAEAFRRNFRDEQEIGASVCVFQGGQPVVDLWGGHADGARTRPWERDTLVNVWSSTKGVMALCVARLNDQGLLDNDRPVADYWPEFAANGKGAVTVAQLFSHQAGVCGPSRQLTEAESLDTDFLADLMAAEAPHWPIGSRSGYHAFTIGPLGDGLFKRVTGRTVGQYFRDELGGPLGVDFHMGLPASEEGRVAETLHDEFPQSGGQETFNEFQRLA